MLTRYKCGHIGKTAGREKKAFIRVAEVRREAVKDSPKQCPACGNSEGAGS